jgi:hypothetical protein
MIKENLHSEWQLKNTDNKKIKSKKTTQEYFEFLKPSYKNKEWSS